MSENLLHMRSFIQGSFILRAKLDSIKWGFLWKVCLLLFGFAWFSQQVRTLLSIIKKMMPHIGAPLQRWLYWSCQFCGDGAHASPVMWLVCLAVCCGKHSCETCHLSCACYYHFPWHVSASETDGFFRWDDVLLALDRSQPTLYFLIWCHQSVPGLFTLLSHLPFFLCHLSFPPYLRERTHCIYHLSLCQIFI